ncbi:MAG: hypothetical protein IPM80_18440 [Proteobacteria bacterium]|nr:hypothetical protein [Pseudomonadota bacterium]
MTARGGLALGFASLTALVLGLFGVQFLTLPKLRDLVVEHTTRVHIATAQGSALDVIKQGWRDALGVQDLLLVTALGLLALWMLSSEMRTRRYSNLLAALDLRPRLMLALVALLGVGVTRYYINSGAVFMGDATMHVEVSAAVAEHLRHWSLPIWSNYWYGGFPLLEYYAPLFFYLSGALNLVLGDIHSAVKTVLFLGHFGSMLTMYWFLSRAVERPSHALIGALCYGLAFHHMHIILYRGDLHMTLVYLIYPLLFLHAEDYFNGAIDARRLFVRMALTSFFLIIAHHAYAFFGLLFFALFVLVRGALATAPATAAWRRLAPPYLGLAGGALMATFLLVPAVMDQAWVRGMPGLPFEILVPTPPRAGFLKAMLKWQIVGDRKNIGYLGLSVAAFAVIGACHAWRRRVPTALGLLAAGLYALFTLRSGMQYNVKNMNFVVFYSAALAAFAPAMLERWRAAIPAPGRAPRVTVALMAILALDLGPSTFQYIYRDQIDFKERMYARIRTLDPNYRTIERQLIFRDPQSPEQESAAAFDPHMLGSVMPRAPLASPFGWVHEAAGLSFGYLVEIGKQMHRELAQNTLSGATLDGLFMSGVKYITFRDRYQYFTPPLPPSPDYTLDDGLLELRHARPLIAAPRLVRADDIAGYDPSNEIETRRYYDDQAFAYDNDDYAKLVTPLLDAMSIDRRHGTAKAIPVLDREAATAAPAGDAALDIEILDFKVDMTHVALRYRANIDSFGQLSFTYFPFLELRVDGQPVAFSRSAFNLIVLALPAGEHLVTLDARASPLRRNAFLITLAATLLVLLTPARMLNGLAVGGARKPGFSRGLS